MIIAAFTDGDTLICAVPSEAKSGLYFVAVRPEREYLSVTYSDSGRMESQGSPIKEAIACYQMWRWWENWTKISVKSLPIILQPHWIQIPVPGTVQSIIQQIKEGERHAAEYFGYCN